MTKPRDPHRLLPALREAFRLAGTPERAARDGARSDAWNEPTYALIYAWSKLSRCMEEHCDADGRVIRVDVDPDRARREIPDAIAYLARAWGLIKSEPPLDGLGTCFETGPSALPQGRGETPRSRGADAEGGGVTRGAPEKNR